MREGERERRAVVKRNERGKTKQVSSMVLCTARVIDPLTLY